MSKEELIKYIKGLTEITKENNKRGIEVGVEISTDMAEQLLNLIEKQQKEIKNIQENIIDTINDLEELQDNEYDGMVQDFIDTLKDLF